MRGALLVLTLAVAACGDDHGVTVIIHPNGTDVTQVRLYIGVGNETMTDLTDDTFKVDGASYWTRDPGNELDLQNVVNHGDVTFNYDTNETIPVVIAVGYDDQGQPSAAGVADSLDPALGRNDFQIYEITLVPADPFSQTTSSAMQIGLWSPMTTDLVHASCAGIIDASKQHPYFVVLDNDQDCDGFIDGTDAECTPDVYHGTRGADPSEANCLFATAASATLGAVCQLGGSPCKDNTPVTMVTCQPGNTCLPSSMCGAGVCPDAHPDDFECAADIVGAMVDPTMHAHYDCTVPTNTNGSVCNGLKLPLDRPPTGGYDCMDFDIGDSRTALGGSIKQDNVTFSADHLDTMKSCAATVSIDGMPTDRTKPLSGLVNFALKNNAGVAIPIVFTFDTTGGCNSQPRCVLDVQTFDDPGQTRCAAGWQAPTVVGLGASVTDAEDPTLTDDQTSMFYVSGGNLYSVPKSGTTWGLSTLIPLPTTDNRSPDVGGIGTANGTSLVYTGDLAGARSIYIASRTAVDTAFTPGVPLVNNTGTVASFTAATFAPGNPNDAAGTKHVLAAGNLGGGPQGLFDVAYDAPTSTIDSITQIPIVNGPQAPDKPHLSPDGLQLYFEGSDLGKVTLYVASRASITDPFKYAVELSELTSPSPASYTGGAWVSPGGRTMYFTQASQTGVDRIFLTTRANLP